jgi:protein-disulfide isomerase
MSPTPFSRRLMLGFAGVAMTPAALSAKPRASAKSKPAGDGLTPPPLLGPATAAERFIIWGSYTCPYTAMLIPIMKGLQSDHPKAVALEWRHYPLHPPDPALHVASMAVAPGRAWDFTAAVLEDYLATEKQTDGAKLLSLLAKFGGDEKSYSRALADPASWATLKRDMLAAQMIGVKLTPAVVIDGYYLTPDGLPSDLKGFDAALRAMVA